MCFSANALLAFFQFFYLNFKIFEKNFIPVHYVSELLYVNANNLVRLCRNLV